MLENGLVLHKMSFVPEVKTWETWVTWVSFSQVFLVAWVSSSLVVVSSGGALFIEE
jgi:hypothetical protein